MAGGIEDKLDAFSKLVDLAYKVGPALVNLIKGYAARDLTDAEYAEVQTRWDALEQRTAHNAGLDT